MTRWRGAAVLVVVALLLAACGVRVSPDLRRRAADAELGMTGGGSGLGAGAGGLAGASGGVAGGAAAGGSQASGGPIAAGATGGAAAGGNQASTAPAGGNGGATDVGVTANSILLGNVSDLSGPVPGLFQGAVTGTLAYLNYVNSQGGVFGRQLKLQSSDSQTECAQEQNDYNSLVGKAFAFVGSFSLYDDCGAQVLGQHKDVPNVSYGLSNAMVSLPNDFSVDPIFPGSYPTGPFLYYKQKFGSAVQYVGDIYPNIPSAAANEKGFEGAGGSVGWKWVYTRAAGATETNFTTDIIAMQQRGVKIVYLAAENAQNAATFVTEAEQQNWHPIFIIPVAYAQNFVQLVGGNQAAEGVYGAQLYSMFFNAQDAQASPEVAAFQQWMKRTNPSQAIDLESMYGWAQAALFVQALKAAGPRATRAGLLTALGAIHSFNDGGMVGVADPAGKVTTNCYVAWQIHNGQFVRQDPPSGYRCDGSLFKP